MRKSGRTTRQVNDIIELLFTNRGKWVIVKDHWDEYSSDEYLLRKVMKRLYFEHRLKDGFDYKTAFTQDKGKEFANKELIKDYSDNYLMIKLNL